MPATRIAVVDDHQLVRIGLKQIVDAQADFAWAGEAGTGREDGNGQYQPHGVPDTRSTPSRDNPSR